MVIKNIPQRIYFLYSLQNIDLGQKVCYNSIRQDITETHHGNIKKRQT